MIIVKPIISILLLVPYILTLGMVTIKATFPDEESICYSGWLK